MSTSVGQTSDDVKMRTDVEELTNIFDTLATYYTLIGDSGRATGFGRVAGILESYPEDSITGDEAFSRKFVGQRSKKIIDEYNDTGKVKRLEDLEAKYGDIKAYYDFFTKFYGIGRHKAIELYNKGIVTEEDMLHRGGLTPVQQSGVLWYGNYSRPIRREEIYLIKNTVINSIKKLSDHYLGGVNVRVEFAGSFRRGSYLSGDIDVLIEKVPGITMEAVVDYLGDLIKVRLKQGDIIFHGIVKYSDYFYGHRIDILLVNSDEWYPALIHFTGSKKFNILMAQRAIDLNGRLSRKAISFYGETIPVDSEEEIFELLGVKYIPPEGRGRDVILTYS